MHMIEYIDECHKQCDLCKINIKNEFNFGWFLKYIVPIIEKYITMNMLQYKEEIIINSHFDIFYS